LACDRFAGALKAYVLGNPLRSDAAAHLAVCSACQALVDGEERLNRIVTSALAGLAEVTPPPELVPALRQAVLQSPGRTPSRWIVQAGAVAVAVAALAIVPYGRAMFQQRQTLDHSQAWRTGMDRTLPPPIARVTTHETSRRLARPRRSRGIDSSTVAATTEVIVPADERRAVGRLFDALREGRPEAVSMLMTLQAGRLAIPQSGDVVVPPLKIDPLTVSNLAPVVDK
jgi:hypothetical protein